MSLKISVEREVNAPAEDAWAVLDDFPNIAGWNSTIQSSQTIRDPDLVTGSGAERRCELGPGKVLEERIVDYADGERMTIDIFNTIGLPIESASSTFSIRPNGNDRSVISYAGDLTPKLPSFVTKLVSPVMTRKFTQIQADLLEQWAQAAESHVRR